MSERTVVAPHSLAATPCEVAPSEVPRTAWPRSAPVSLVPFPRQAAVVVLESHSQGGLESRRPSPQILTLPLPPSSIWLVEGMV